MLQPGWFNGRQVGLLLSKTEMSSQQTNVVLAAAFKIRLGGWSSALVRALLSLWLCHATMEAATSVS